ncbi:MAG: hypothetical protein A2Y71_03090 [Bacteroidetes bacterium RBG_13_42_15]|nr:MAG: hypothetical protein A2Y71_03090 [Bacteroidetes bacterium RBG_13_42_15]
MASNNIHTTEKHLYTERDRTDFFAGLAIHMIKNTMQSISDLTLKLASAVKDPEDNQDRIHEYIETIKRRYEIIDRSVLSLNKFKSIWHQKLTIM